MEGKDEFSNWFVNLDTSNMKYWLIMGDFNYIRGPENRNKDGGDHNNMMVFNNMIMAQDLVEIPLKGRAFTWSNMQDFPLLEKIDWIFSSADAPQISLTLWQPLWLNYHLIMCLLKFRLTATFQNQRSSSLKNFGWNLKDLLKLLNGIGTIALSSLILQRILLPNLKVSE